MVTQKFDPYSAFAMIDAVLKWNPGDFVLHDGRYLAFFHADGEAKSQDEILPVVIDIFNKNFSAKAKMRDEGFFILSPSDSDELKGERKSLKVMSLPTPAKPRIGVVAANIKALEEQFRAAEDILIGLGVTRDRVPTLRNRTLQTRAPDQRKIKETETVGETNKITRLLNIDYQSIPIIKHLPFRLSKTNSKESLTEKKIEETKELTIDSGAARSALIINMIAERVGCPNLHHLRRVSTLREIRVDESFYDEGDEEPPSDNAVSFFLEQISQLDASLKALRSSAIAYYKDVLNRVERSLKPGGLSQEHIEAGKIALNNILRELGKNQTAPMSFRVTNNLNRVALDFPYGEVAPLTYAAEFGDHVFMLLACIENEKEQLKTALVNIQTGKVRESLFKSEAKSHVERHH